MSRRVSIHRSKRYLYPRESLPDDPYDTRGSLALRDEPYYWNYDDTSEALLSDEGYPWDLYDDDADGIYLWPRVNNSARQKFPLDEFETWPYEAVDSLLLFTGSRVPWQVTEMSEDGAGAGAAAAAGVGASSPFKMTSYNTLVPEPEYELELIRSIPKHTRWTHRKDLVKNAVADADVFALVEATQKTIDYVVDPATHDHVFKPKEYDHDGSVLAWNKSRFVRVNHFGNQLIVDRPQVVLSVVLRERNTQKDVCFTVLHLKSGYDDQEPRRVSELEIALSQTEKWLLKLGLSSIPRIVCGDLNSDSYPPHKSLVKYHMLTSGYQDVMDDLPWRRPTYAHWHRSIFDYIFIKGDIVSVDTNVPTLADGEICPNSNPDKGSDHLPISCTLLI